MGAHELAFVGLAGCGLGTVLGLPMVWPRSRRSPDVRLLGGAVLLTSAIAALISARLAGLAPASAVVEHAINILGLCAFPILVVYARYAVAAPVTLRAAAYWWLPAIAYVALVTGRIASGLETRVPFVYLLPVILAFTGASVVILVKGGGGRRAGIIPVEWVVAFLVLVNVAQVVRMEFSHIGVVRALVPLVLFAGFLAIAAFAAWRTFAAAGSSAIPVLLSPYQKSGLDPSVAPNLLARIDGALTRDRLFTRADLTLGQLSAAVSATPHQVSEVLNRYGGMSFHDLINRRRVEDVKAQLLNPDSDRFTIEGIGGSAGFGSRSALYAAFRRFEGITPTAYRALQRRPPHDT